MYLTPLEMHQTPQPAEAEGRNGWFKLSRILVSVHTSPGDPTAPALLRLEGFATRSTWRAPIVLECANVEDIRALAALFTTAADVMEKLQGDPDGQTTE